MKIGFYNRIFKEKKHLSWFLETIENLTKEGNEIWLHEDFYAYLQNEKKIHENFPLFNTLSVDNKILDMLVSIGGDGTILDSVYITRDSGVPVLGINTGRLGFLASTSIEEGTKVLNDVIKGAYSIDSRSLILLESSDGNLFDFPYGLNDFVIHKKETSSMITVHTYLNGEYLTSYWADGLICSTPTGSSGYSLSCGGPIIFPQSGSLVITPIAPHNLNMRPVVIPDEQVLTFEIEGRSQEYLISLDSRSVTISPDVQLAIRRATFTFNLIRPSNDNFLDTLRHKMMWGIDKRN